MAAVHFQGKNPEDARRMRRMFAPSQVDQQIRMAIQFCWMMLPAKRRTAAELERQIRRIVDRALKDLHEDISAFGLGQ